MRNNRNSPPNTVTRPLRSVASDDDLRGNSQPPARAQTALVCDVMMHQQLHAPQHCRANRRLRVEPACNGRAKRFNDADGAAAVRDERDTAE
jgi:hypothetical protein